MASQLPSNQVCLVNYDLRFIDNPLDNDNITTCPATNVVTEYHGQILHRKFIAAIVKLEASNSCVDFVKNYLSFSKNFVFVIIFHKNATEDPIFRWNAFSAGANMVTSSDGVVDRVLKKAMCKQQGIFECPYCQMRGFEEEELRTHVPLYHESQPSIACVCPVCSLRTHNFSVHIFYEHGSGQREVKTGCFGICVVQRPSDKAFLMVQEFQSSGYWVPGGQLNPGETFVEGAKREAIEEAGVEIEIKGILEINVSKSGNWRRVLFFAVPADPDAPPKTEPDFESAGACWLKYEQLKHLVLRDSSIPMTYFKHILEGRQPADLVVPPNQREFFLDPPLM